MDAVTLESAVKEYQAQHRLSPVAQRCADALQDVLGPARKGLVGELIAEFGLGEQPALRRVLYERIARAFEQAPDKVKAMLADARMLAKEPTVKRKGNYFARAMKLKLLEAGMG